VSGIEPAPGPGGPVDEVGEPVMVVAPTDATETESPDGAAPVELTEAGLEALLFVAERPLSRREIAAIVGVDRATVDARLGDLELSLAGRGIRLLVDGDRVELATAPEAGVLIARYVGADAVRLSSPALETLAIVAYRQPVTKAVVERIRGVDSDYTIRALLHRRLIVELGRSEAPGRPYLYGTGFDFLERFGLTSLDELPPLDAEIAARLIEETDEASASVSFGLAPDAGARLGLAPDRGARLGLAPDAAPDRGARLGLALDPATGSGDAVDAVAPDGA